MFNAKPVRAAQPTTAPSYYVQDKQPSHDVVEFDQKEIDEFMVNTVRMAILHQPRDMEYEYD